MNHGLRSVSIGILLVITCFCYSPANPSPTPKPTVTPAVTAAPVTKRLALNVQSEAAVVADHITTQTNAFIIAADMLANGLPQRGDKPAIPAKDIQAAMPAENVARIQAAANALK